MTAAEAACQCLPAAAVLLNQLHTSAGPDFPRCSAFASLTLQVFPWLKVIVSMREPIR